MFPVAVTTETSGMGSVVRWIRLCGCCGRSPTPRVGVVCCVWGGLGVDRIVDASLLPYRSPAGTPTHARCVVLLGVLLFVLAY